MRDEAVVSCALHRARHEATATLDRALREGTDNPRVDDRGGGWGRGIAGRVAWGRARREGRRRGRRPGRAWRGCGKRDFVRHGAVTRGAVRTEGWLRSDELLHSWEGHVRDRHGLSDFLQHDRVGGNDGVVDDNGASGETMDDDVVRGETRHECSDVSLELGFKFIKQFSHSRQGVKVDTNNTNHNFFNQQTGRRSDGEGRRGRH